MSNIFGKHLKKNKSGFTLVEVMVAGSILLLFCAGFFSSYLVSMRAQRTAINHYRALCLARNRIQRARSMEFTSLDLLAETAVAVDTFGNPDPMGLFERTTLVVPLTNTTADITQLTVQIRYQTAAGRLSSNPLAQTTLIANPM